MMVEARSEYSPGMNPISCLAQIQEARKEKEPGSALLSEKAMNALMLGICDVVEAGSDGAAGTGPNKQTRRSSAVIAWL